jgi:predicted AAA+ superfamily ATPase
MEIGRPRHLDRLRVLLERFPVVAIIGPRQVGKTTLARALAAQAATAGPVTVFDLEDPRDLNALSEPALVLEPLRGLVILDEVQQLPALFPLLRVLVDRPGNPARFLVLGSASPDLVQRGSESLAGRIIYHEVGGLALDEVGAEATPLLWRRGGFPRSFLAAGEEESFDWRSAFVRTFLERDLPQLGITIPTVTLRRFWTMIAHYHGQLWNGTEVARAFGVSPPTVRRYLDLLCGALVLRQLPPWFENLGKRQVKAPKVYVADAGVLHSLLGLVGQEDLERHPKVGASWEGFALGEVATRLGARTEECFLWATHGGAELDLLVVRGNVRLGFELKRTATPTVTRSMHGALADLKLDRLDVVYPGHRTYPLGDRIRALALPRLLKDLQTL